MKRQIKFRGRWQTTSGKYEWEYGVPYTSWEGQTAILFQSVRGDEDYFRALSMSAREVDPSTIGQFTGLKDLNGKEIYEGDLLECHKLRRPPFEVYYNTVQGAFCLIERTFKGIVLHGKEALGRVLGVFPDMVVIGNIHDNPIEE